MDTTLQQSAESWLVDLCAEGIFATAGQLSVRLATGPEFDLAVGHDLNGRTLTANHVSEVFCLTKPLVAMAAVLACESAKVGLDHPVGELLPALQPSVGRLTVTQIVNHDAGLKAPPALTWMIDDPDERPDLASLRIESGRAAYSEISGWLVLTELITRLTGESPASYVRSAVTEPLEIRATVLLTGEDAAEAARSGRLMGAVGGLPSDAIPMLHAFSNRYQRGVGPVLGGWSTASALATFYSALGMAVARGTASPGLPSPPTLRSILAARRDLTFDETWGRPASFGLGMEVIEDGDGDPEVLQLRSATTTAHAWVDLTTGDAGVVIANGAMLSNADRDELDRSLASAIGR
ncbi:MAG: beta-lactamase family protein [Acidimicrobiales bacterium]|nr:beta-lactamase family protein [Acidimicrobiales bacterium]